MFNSLRPDGGRISPGPRGHGNFRGDEIVSCTLANVASEVRAFKSLIFQSKTNATAQSRSTLLASSISFLFFYSSNADTGCQDGCRDSEQKPSGEMLPLLLLHNPNSPVGPNR